MPQIGEVKTGKELGYINLTSRFIWSACLGCGKQRWVQLLHGKPKRLRCCSCATKQKGFKGKNHPSWKGGRINNSLGYIEVKLQPDDFFYPMAHKLNHYVMEHRLIMAKYLNRCLLSWEVVHHKNGVRNDNRIENLELLPHKRFHLTDLATKRRITELEKRITILEVENILLKKQLEKQENVTTNK